LNVCFLYFVYDFIIIIIIIKVSQSCRIVAVTIALLYTLNSRSSSDEKDVMMIMLHQLFLLPLT